MTLPTRLLDEPRTDDAVKERARVLVSSFPVAPASDAAAARVMRRLQEKPERRRTWVLRPAFALVILLFAGGVAASPAVRNTIAQTWNSLTGGATIDRPAEQRPAAPERVTHATEREPTQPTTPEVVPAEVPPVSRRTVERRAPPPPASSAEAAEIIVRGIRALREQGDTVQAQRNFNEYLRRYPRGELAEEAQALALEAEVKAAGPMQKQLAREYLRRWPKGRFARGAQQALERP